MPVNIPQFEAGLGDPSAALLTIIPETQQAELRDAAGNNLLHPTWPYSIPKPEQADFRLKPSEPALAEVTEWFCRMYLEMGEGKYRRGEIVAATGDDLHRWRIHKAAVAFSRVLPHTHFANLSPAIGFGNLRIAERHATAEELAAHEDRQRENAERAERERAERSARRLAAAGQEQAKLDLTQHDHAFITIGFRERPARFYSLPLDSPDAVLAARVLEAGSQLVDKSLYLLNTTRKIQEVASLAFALMSDAERKLFIGRRRSGDFIVPIRELAKGLLAPMGVAHKEAGADKVSFGANKINVDYYETPPEDPYDEGEVDVLLPPGNPSSEAVQEAHALLDLVYGPDATTIGPTDAIRILDLIKQRDGKRALMAALRGGSYDVTYASAEHYFTVVALHHLREGFDSANIDRTIGGNVNRRGVQQIGGRLPGGNTMWQIGVPDKEDGRQR